MYFVLTKNVYNNLCYNFKYEIDFMMKHKEYLAEHTIKDKTNWLLSKNKYGNDIHEQGKQ